MSSLRRESGATKGIKHKHHASVRGQIEDRQSEGARTREKCLRLGQQERDVIKRLEDLSARLGVRGSELGDVVPELLPLIRGACPKSTFLGEKTGRTHHTVRR
jgi:hypothetical protein